MRVKREREPRIKDTMIKNITEASLEKLQSSSQSSGDQRYDSMDLEQRNEEPRCWHTVAFWNPSTCGLRSLLFPYYIIWY